MKKASNILCLNPNAFPPSLILVSLKTDLTDFGLPGGSVDDGETFEQAAVREMKEETGVTICVKNAKIIQDKVDGHGFHVKTFMVTDFDYSQELKSEEIAAIKWAPVSDLLKSKKYKQTCEEVYGILNSIYKFDDQN